MQGSLPAGWLAFTGRELNPLDRDEGFQITSSSSLPGLFLAQRPIPAVVWHIDNPQIAMVVIGLSVVGWLIVLTSTFLINHFELFGLHQVANNLAGRPTPAPRFRTPLYYEFVRHPI